MKVATSYFYQVRFFKRNMLPLSTAVWDPKWYHDFQDQETYFVDKRGIVNGLRCIIMAPQNHDCHGPDGCTQKGQNVCSFKQAYREQLAKINVSLLLNACEELCDTLIPKDVEEEPVVVFLVHEAPDNPCSERALIQEFFRNNGIECNELSYPIS